MTAKTIDRVEERIQLSGISWQTDETLLTELSASRRVRLAYNRGILEIMVPSPERERYKKIIGRFVETLAEELEISIEPLGSTISIPTGAEQSQMNVFTFKTSMQLKEKRD